MSDWYRGIIDNPREYGILYAQAVFPKGHKLEWIRYCALTDILPKDLQKEIKNLSTEINDKYKDVIIVPMDNKILPGCITKPESIEEVSSDIYQGMLNIFKKLTGDTNCVRLVYGVGEMDSDWIETKTDSTHEVGNFPIMVKVGRTLDSSNEPGIFRV